MIDKKIKEKLKELAKKYEVSYATMLLRYKKYGNLEDICFSNKTRYNETVPGLRALAKEKGVSYETMRRRYKKYGNLEDISFPSKKIKRITIKEYKGKPLKEIAKELGIALVTLQQRLHKYGDIEKCLFKAQRGKKGKYLNDKGQNFKAVTGLDVSSKEYLKFVRLMQKGYSFDDAVKAVLDKEQRYNRESKIKVSKEKILELVNLCKNKNYLTLKEISACLDINYAKVYYHLATKKIKKNSLN